jgi:hypothetical protein
VRWLGFIAILLSGCSLQGSIGPNAIGPFRLPPGEKIVEGPAGLIETPDTPAAPPIETVLTGLSQAQSVRSLVRQLSR